MLRWVQETLRTARSASGPNWRLTVWVFTLLVLFGVVPLLWTACGLGRGFDVHQKQVQLDEARRLSSQVAKYRQSLRDQVSAIARTLEIDAERVPFSECLDRIREQQALDRYIDGERLMYVNVVDAATGRGPWSGLRLKDGAVRGMLREGFLRGQHGTAVVSVPVVSASLFQQVLIIGEPVLTANGVQGVVLAVAGLEPLRQMTAESGEWDRLEVSVVDNRRRLITNSRHGSPPLAADMSGIDMVRFFLREEGRGEPVRRTLVTDRPVPDDSGWVVIVRGDIATHRQLYLLLVTVTLVLLIWLVGPPGHAKG